MECIALGVANKRFKGLPEGISAQADENALTILMTYNNPTEEEINDVQNGSIDFGLTIIDKIPMMTIRFSDKHFMDCPISTENELKPINFEEGYGYITSIILVDINTGVVKSLRCIGLSTGLSRKINESLLNKELTLQQFIFKVLHIQSEYTTDMLVDQSELTFRITGG